MILEHDKLKALQNHEETDPMTGPAELFRWWPG